MEIYRHSSAQPPSRQFLHFTTSCKRSVEATIIHDSMTSKLPIPMTYEKTDSKETKITPVMSASSIPFSAAMASGLGYYIPTKMPLSDKEVAIMKASQQKADAEAAASDSSRRSVETMDMVDWEKNNLALPEVKKKKTLGPYSMQKHGQIS